MLQGALVDAVEAELAATRAAVAGITDQVQQHAAAVAEYQRRLRETVMSEESLLGAPVTTTENEAVYSRVRETGAVRRRRLVMLRGCTRPHLRIRPTFAHGISVRGRNWQQVR